MMRLSRYVQWRYVLPRTIIVALVVLVVWLGTEPLLHAFFTRIGERIVRAKVDIDSVDIKFTSTDMTVNRVAVANPRNLDRNLVECESATFDVVTSSVFQRRLHIREARLTGVQFNTPRSKSGQVDLPGINVDVSDDLETKLKSMGSGALRQFARMIAQDLQDELLSIELSRELAARWPQKYAELHARAQKFAARIKEIEMELEGTGENRLGMAASFPERVQEVDALREEVLDIGRELDEIAQQIQRDRESILIARRHDEQIIRKKLSLREIDPQQLSEYLLDEELSEKAHEMLRWIKLARRYWPSDLELPEADRSHGEDVVFPGLKQFPRAFVEHMRLDGTLKNGVQTVCWRGEILNLTTDPQVVGKPMVIRAETKCDQPLIIEATLDRTTNVPCDRIVLSLPSLQQAERKLGNPEQLAVGLSRGKVQVWAELNLVGEKLSGRLLIAQNDMQITTQLSPTLGERLSQRVSDATKHVNKFQAEVKLGGTLDKPTWELRSNLGPQLAASITKALQAELDVRKGELSASLDQYLASEQAKLDSYVAEQQQGVTNLVADGTLELDGLRRQVAGRIKLPGSTVLDDLPKLNPFMRR